MTSFESINPATESIIQSFRVTSCDDIDSFVAQSQLSFNVWKDVSVEDRISILKRFASCLEKKSNIFSKVISQENGKPYWEANLEVKASISKIDLVIKAYEQRVQSYRIDTTDSVLSTAYKPIGTLAVLGPFNFPLLLPLGHIIPALFVGNIVLF